MHFFALSFQVAGHHCRRWSQHLEMETVFALIHRKEEEHRMDGGMPVFNLVSPLYAAQDTPAHSTDPTYTSK